jgi:hypothetical protein
MNATYFEGYLTTGCFELIATDYPLISVRDKTEPNAGSPCYRTERITKFPSSINKIVSKRRGGFVVYTDEGVFRFWHKENM